MTVRENAIITSLETQRNGALAEWAKRDGEIAELKAALQAEAAKVKALQAEIEALKAEGKPPAKRGRS